MSVRDISFFCIILVLKRSLQNPPVNIALGKTVRHCSGTTDRLTDGLFEFFVVTCNAYSDLFFEVQLDQGYYITYVELYCAYSKSNPSNKFDYFIVSTQNDNGTEEFCNQFALPLSLYTPKIVDSFRVNCINQNDKFNKVILKLDQGYVEDGHQGTLSEISVYSFSTVENPEEIFLHIGCFLETVVFGASTTFPFTGFWDCIRSCKAYTLFIMAVNQANKICLCASNITSHGEALLQSDNKSCNDRCDKVNYFCGGNLVVSVYLLQYRIPTLHKCIELDDVIQRYKSLGKHISTLTGCYKNCSNFPYAFLMKDKCHCETSISSVPRVRCNYLCNDQNPDNICVGSMYLLGCQPYMPCDRFYHCEKGFNVHGECIEGLCKPSQMSLQYASPFCIGLERPATPAPPSTSAIPSTPDLNDSTGPDDPTEPSDPIGPTDLGPHKESSPESGEETKVPASKSDRETGGCLWLCFSFMLFYYCNYN